MDITSSPTPTRITASFAGEIESPRWRFIAKLLCIISGAVGILAFVLNLVGLTVYSRQIPAATLAALEQLGLTSAAYFWIYVVISCVIFVPFFTVGVIIYLRRPNEQIAIISTILLISFGGALLPLINFYALGYLRADEDLTRLALTLSLAGIFSWPLVGLFLTIFPDGRFVPGWSRYIAIGNFIFALLWGLFPETFYSPEEIWVVIVGLVPIILFGGGFYAQFYRYRHVSTPLQRQQTKWFVAALGLNVIAVALVSLPFVINPTIMQPDPGVASLMSELLYAISNLFLIILPIAVGFAILRYRLWDVDLLINKSLVYAVVTAIALAIFFAAALILQIVVGSQQPLIALAIAVVLCAALWNPLRKRVQSVVDRRLYRLRFDLNELSAAQKLPEIQNPGSLSGRKLGDYDVLDVIGKGGMGEVYKGQADGRLAALKILPDDLAKQEDFRKRFEREASTLQALSHANIVKIYGSGASDGIAYLAMEYIDGGDLSARMKHQGKMSLDEIRDIFSGLCSALDAAHAQGFVHRDIKPSNIMLRKSQDGETWEAVLMDFGVAKIGDTRTRLTGTGVIGTIDYMAPEQIMAAKEVDHRADIYALGVMLYEMMVGECPFKGSPGQVMFAHLQQPAPDPRDSAPGLPRTAAHTVMKCLAKNPEERFSSAGELFAALQ